MTIAAVVTAEEVGAISYKWVPIGEMFRPAELQRPMDEKHVQKIIDDWNGAAFGVPILSFRKHGNRGPRGESFAVVSGQHRVEAARRMGRATIFCVVVDGLSIADESRLFNDEDSRKRQSPLHKFHLDRRAGNTEAVTIWETCNDVGFIIAREKGEKSKRSVTCVTALYTAHRRGNLAATMRILADAFDYDAKASRSEIISGLSLLLSLRPSIDRKRMATRMRAVGVLALVQRYAMARAAAGSSTTYGNATPIVMANVLIGSYNHALREGKIDAVTFGDTRALPGGMAQRIDKARPAGLTLAEARERARAGAS